MFFLDSDVTHTPGIGAGRMGVMPPLAMGVEFWFINADWNGTGGAVKNNEHARVVLSDLKEMVDLAGGVSRFSVLNSACPAPTADCTIRTAL